MKFCIHSFVKTHTIYWDLKSQIIDWGQNKKGKIYWASRLWINSWRFGCSLTVKMEVNFDRSDGHKAVSTNEPKLQLITLIEGYFSKPQTCERSIAIRLGRQNYASALTAKISSFCALSHCIQIGVFKCGCGREGQHLSFLWTYAKHHTYCRFWRDPAFSSVFPPNWFSQLEAVWGLGEMDSREPLSDPQLGSNNTAYPSLAVLP